MKTVAMEELPLEARQVMEQWLSQKAPIAISLAGQICGEFSYFDPEEEISTEVTPEEEAELMEVFREAEANYATGKFITLEEFKQKNSSRLRGIAR